MMTNPKPEEPVRRPPTEVDDDWFTRIQRAKAAREQGQKAPRRKPAGRSHPSHASVATS